MKVAILNDLSPFSHMGSGAEASIEVMMKEGWKREHTIDAFTAQTCPQELSKYDIVILKNIVSFNFTDKQMDCMVKIVNWPSDYSFCRWRLFYRWAPACKKCAEPSGSIFRRDMNIFLSPLHKKVHEAIFDNMAESFCIPSPIDVRKFTDKKMPRRPKSMVGINSLLNFKGKETIQKYCADHGDTMFNFFGGKDDPIQLPPNAKYYGMVPNEDLSTIFNEHEYFIHLPETPQPFERTAVEAYLSGCKLMVNNMVGAITYDWWTDRETVRDHVGHAAEDIWTLLEAL